MVRIKKGMRVRFDPCESCFGRGADEMVVGKVVAVYRRHGWFSVAYGNNLRTSFHFCEVGKGVTVCG